MSLFELSLFESDRPLGRIARLPLRLVPRDAVVPVLGGELRGCHWIVGSGHYRCWMGWFELCKQHAVARLLRPGAVFYDVGAHAGFYSLLAARKGCRVFAFEPSPRNIQMLKQHIALNHLNVEVIEAAVADHDGTAVFDVGPNTYMGSLAERGELQVKVVSLDALKIPPPDFVKIDIEGGEYGALMGAARVIKENKPTVFLATHGAAMRERCPALLRSWNFEVTQLEAPDEWIATPL